MKKLMKKKDNSFNDVNAFKNWGTDCHCERCSCVCNNDTALRSSEKLSAVQNPNYYTYAHA